jgi:hypothetical protein
MENAEKCRLNCEIIWKIWKKGKLNSEKIWKMRKKSRLKCEMIMENMEERQAEM